MRPCQHRGMTDDDFFAGKFDGNWRLKVVPKRKVYIPNIIVIGQDVMAKAVYTKRLGYKSDMCTNCYKEGHFKRDCPGSRKWEDYCKEFKDLWEGLVSERYENEDLEQAVENDDDGLLSKVSKSEKEKKKILKKNEEEKKKGEEEKRKLKEQLEKSNKSMEELKKRKEMAESKVEALGKDLIESEKKTNMVVRDLQRQTNSLSENVDIRDEVLQRDYRIEESENERRVNAKEIEGLKKILNVVDKTLKENQELKVELDALKNEKMEVQNKLRVFEDNVKSTSRRLSRSHKMI